MINASDFSDGSGIGDLEAICIEALIQGVSGEGDKGCILFVNLPVIDSVICKSNADSVEALDLVLSLICDLIEVGVLPLAVRTQKVNDMEGAFCWKTEVRNFVMLEFAVFSALLKEVLEQIFCKLFLGI